MDPNELQSQLVGIQYSQNMDGVFERQHQAYSDIEMTGVDGDINEQENETETQVPMYIGNGDQQIIYNPMCSY